MLISLFHHKILSTSCPFISLHIESAHQWIGQFDTTNQLIGTVGYLKVPISTVLPVFQPTNRCQKKINSSPFTLLETSLFSQDRSTLNIFFVTNRQELKSPACYVWHFWAKQLKVSRNHLQLNFPLLVEKKSLCPLEPKDCFELILLVY